LIKTGNDQVDILLNKDLKNRFTNNQFPELPTDSTLLKWATEQVVYLNFEITYNKNNLISLVIIAEACGAHCNGWTEQFTYSTATGKYISITDIIDTTGEFKNIVIAEKNKQFAEQKQELKKMYADKTSGLDEETYKTAIALYDECEQKFMFDSFALYHNHLEIINECYFPNALKPLIPIIELKFRYKEIVQFLNVVISEEY
jgi:hypothetical protein